MPSVSTIFGACEPLPEPGGPNRIMIFLLPPEGAEPVEMAPVLLSPICFAYTLSSFLTTFGPTAPLLASFVMYASHSARSTEPLLSVSTDAIIDPARSDVVLRRFASSAMSIVPLPSLSARLKTLVASAFSSIAATCSSATASCS